MPSLLFDWYEEYVRERGQAVPLSESRDAVAARYVTHVEAGGPRLTGSLLEEGYRLFDAEVKPQRRRRVNSFTKDLDYTFDSLFGLADDGIFLDPLLDNVYPLGTADGCDKALRLWTVDDFNQARTERYRNVVAVTGSAGEFDRKYAARAIEMMQARGITYFGDLVTAPQVVAA
ncbi:MAG: hypothetical protein FWG25_03735 [Promicromonosporaceae bacterium]|nr:hypothetical protein [Promicromonosporaceae bacterium]